MKLQRLLPILLLLFAVAIPAQAAQVVSVEWTAPTTRTDGTSFDPATELLHYDFQCGTAAGGPYDAATVEISGGTSSYELTAGEFFPGYGDYVCVMTATDADGLESPPSNEVSIAYERAPPSAPGGLTIRITIN